jgi:parallel beta-helix repeat protein
MTATQDFSANRRQTAIRRLSAVLAACLLAPAGLGLGSMGVAQAQESVVAEEAGPAVSEGYGPRNLILNRTNRPDRPVQVRDRDASPVDAVVQPDARTQERRLREQQAERDRQERDRQRQAERQQQEQQRQAERQQRQTQQEQQRQAERQQRQTQQEQQRQAERQRQEQQRQEQQARDRVTPAPTPVPAPPSDRVVDNTPTAPAIARILYVNANTGSDGAIGTSQAAPYRTISHALRQARPGDTVQLAAGTYNASTGEQFPLVIPSGVTLRGDEASEGKSVQIVGGGNYLSRTFAGQNVTIAIANPNAIVSGITVTNPNTRGTGLWIEGADPTIRFSVFRGSHRDGVFVTGTSNPTIHNCVFVDNGGNGMAITRSSGGEIRDSWFQSTGFGLAIGGAATPLLLNNHIVNNNDGIVISDSASPTLRGNIIENNSRDGIVAILRAQPDLGTATNPGNNRLSNNGRFHLNNATNGTFTAIGNNLVGGRISGQAQTR